MVWGSKMWMYGKREARIGQLCQSSIELTNCVLAPIFCGKLSRRRMGEKKEEVLVLSYAHFALVVGGFENI